MTTVPSGASRSADPAAAPGVRVPDPGLVVLVGESAAARAELVAGSFAPHQVVSLDACRALVGARGPGGPAADSEAFALLLHLVRVRLGRGALTVVDSGDLHPERRAALRAVAKECELPATALLVSGGGPAPSGPPSVRALAAEGFRAVYSVPGPGHRVGTVAAPWDLRRLRGPFDLIGDVHGCRAELEELLTDLGYAVSHDHLGRAAGAEHPDGRTAVFVGDLVDRGPDTPGVLRLVMGMTASGAALSVTGNHEDKLVRALGGAKVTPSHGLAASLDQLAAETSKFRAEVLEFCAALPHHLVLDSGALVVAHAGLKESLHGRDSQRVRSFALYGQTTGGTDPLGLPVRLPWALHYRGEATVVYGHVPTDAARWVGRTLCLDTGCVFGGRLTALRYPEREIKGVPARRVWSAPRRPLGTDPLSADSPAPEPPPGRHPARTGAPARAAVLPDPAARTASGEGGEHTVATAHGPVRVPAAGAAAALRALAATDTDPRWLLFLPPLEPRAPSAPGAAPGPSGALRAYADSGVDRVLLREHHVGTRAVVVVCRDHAAARRRFAPGATGAVVTSAGRALFADPAVEDEFLADLRSGLTDAGLWDRLGQGRGGTDWLAFDGVVLPWSAAGSDPVRTRFAPAVAAAHAALTATAGALTAAGRRGLDVSALTRRVAERTRRTEEFTDSYRRLAWPTDGAAGVRFAPLRVLAAEGSRFCHHDHTWHLGIAERLADSCGRVRTTRYLSLHSDHADSARHWWQALRDSGVRSMTVAPWAGPEASGRRGLAHPAFVVSGPEDRLLAEGPYPLGRSKSAGSGRAAGAALMQHRLGLEALARHTAGAPLDQVHAAVAAVLALSPDTPEPPVA